MNQTVSAAAPEVPPEEVERRIAEYRRICLERQLPEQVVYHEPHVVCPWPGCGLQIQGIRFELETLAPSAQLSHWREVWWDGPGLVGRCPRCRQYVLFDVTGKQAVADAAGWPVVLPDDWHQRAHLVPPPPS
jgi:hypothetical protein